MVDDRNKTEMTKQVTSAAINYLDERGCKPVETEVPVDRGWVADVASVVDPTVTELIALGLIERSPGGWGDPRRAEWAQDAQQAQRLLTALVEVKISRSDFCGDRKWMLPIPVNLAYIAIPNDLKLAPAEIPAGWGLLVLHGDCVRLQQKPQVQNVSTERQLSVVLQVAIRRDHNTRYQRLRELQRREVDRRSSERSITRVMQAFRVIESIVNGKHESVERALEYHGVRNIPKYYLPELEKLWSIAAKETVTPA